MASENVEYLNGIYERWSQGDFRTPIAEEFVLDMGPDLPDAGRYEGPEGVATYTRGFLEPWERITISAEKMIDREDSVLVRVHQVGTGMISGVETEQRYFHLWTFKGSVPIRMQTTLDESEAMSRLGVG